MGQSTDQYISSLLEKYTPSESEFDAARTHRAGIEGRLDAFIGLREMFETGSLRHGTGVSMFSDADYIVSLKGLRTTASTALDRVKNALQSKYTGTVIQVRRPAVVCRFNDGKETVEVVPAYPADTGYWIADPRTSDWMRAHPKQHNSYVGGVNQKHSGAAKKMARLAKTWKYEQNVPLSSCYLEMRAAKYVEGEDHIDLAQDMFLFLRLLQRIDLAPMNDPTSLNSRFNAYSSEPSKREALSKLSTAVARAEKAKDYYLNGTHDSAISNLRLLFNQ